MNQKNGMNDEQQIEEIALVLCGMTKGCDGCTFNKEKCFEYQDAKRIYNAGYRKQIEAEWIEDGYNDEPCVCSHCGAEANYISTFKETFDYDYEENLQPTGYEEVREYIKTPYCPHCRAKMK